MHYDLDLHLFVTDDGIFAIKHLIPMVQTWRKDHIGPVLSADGKGEGTAIGYATALRDPQDGLFRVWYTPHTDALIRLAVSEDGLSWTRRGIVMDGWPPGRVDNLHVSLPTDDVDPWFRGARFVGTAFFSPLQPSGEWVAGIYGIRSPDGTRWELRHPPILPKVGDRSALVLDVHRGVYMFTSRPPYEINSAVDASKPRKIALWESPNLVDWQDRGIVLRADERDAHYAQLYGMVAFRYGPGYLGLPEVYYPDLERLDTQLAYSADSLRWERVRRREVVLPWGGEGSWDSHWVVPTLNPPMIVGDRLLFLYIGAATKHGSGLRHHRAIGTASLRRDGWVSLEAGRVEGQVVTTTLPLDRPMQLEANVSCPTGYFAAEVLHADGTPIEGYGPDKGRVEAVDATRHRATWGDRAAVAPAADGLCRLRLSLYQGSLFSYRWCAAGR